MDDRAVDDLLWCLRQLPVIEMRRGHGDHFIVKQQPLLHAVPIALAHADADIDRFLMQVGNAQAGLQANADMRVQRLERRQAWDQPGAAERGQHRDHQFIGLGLGLDQARGFGDISQRLANLQGVQAPVFAHPQAATFAHEQGQTDELFQHFDLLADG
jgi:hypothetical protein